MKKYFLALIIVLISLPSMASGDNVSGEKIMRGTVETVLEEGTSTNGIEPTQYQILEVEIKDVESGGSETVRINHGVIFPITDAQKVTQGDAVVVSRVESDDGIQYFIIDSYRLPALLLLFGFFFVVTIMVAGKRGVTSLLGLAFSIGAIGVFIVPQIIDGKNPFVISIIGAGIIAVASLYLAHGFNARTTVALAGTLISLFIAAVFSIIFSSIGKVIGMGNEDAFFLEQFGPIDPSNLRGLLLGGIIIGTLGVLDDITVSQSAAVYELKKANSSLSFGKLYSHGMAIGREHIASLVNTLALAYAGAALPLFIIFGLNADAPFWLALNNQAIAEEVVRTLVGSLSLVLAVPITTLLASWHATRGVL
ncbi:MAG: YibE/F family protein, partial [Patescibacteria group bacterium]